MFLTNISITGFRLSQWFSDKLCFAVFARLEMVCYSHFSEELPNSIFRVAVRRESVKVWGHK